MCDECRKLNDHFQNRSSTIDVLVICTHKKKESLDQCKNNLPDEVKIGLDNAFKAHWSALPNYTD